MLYRDKSALLASFLDKTTRVLDVGFWGQGSTIRDMKWPHRMIQERAGEVYGIDLNYDETLVSPADHYKKSSAENFDFNVKFDVIFAGDIIEHLSNPGMFLDACKRNIASNGVLVITTPNCFDLFNMAEKLTKREPTVNKDHTCYFSEKTILQLLKKNGWQGEIHHMYTLDYEHQESWRKKILNVIYFLLSKITTKFIGTIVVVAQPS